MCKLPRRSAASAARGASFRLAALLAASMVSCTDSPRPVDPRPLVAVSVSPFAYFVEQLAGDRVAVAIMVPPGANPHMWEPSLEDVRAANAAALYVKVGHPHLPYETTWLTRLIESNSKVALVNCSAAIDQLEEDPHIWVSPAVVRSFVPAIATALRTLLPADAAAITANETRLLAAIDVLDQDVKRILAAASGNRFYVFHPAWGYFARDYGLVQIAIEEDSKEPSPARLARLIGAARAEGTQAIFVQPQVSERSAEVVAGEIGAKLVAIDPLARDWPAGIRAAAEAIAAAATRAP